MRKLNDRLHRILYWLLLSVSFPLFAQSPQANTGTTNGKENSSAQVSEENSGQNIPLPLADEAPVQLEAEYVHTHVFQVGLVASNMGYYDSGLKNTLYLGFFRPYARYFYRANTLIQARGKISAKAFASKPAAGDRTSFNASIEMLSFRHRNGYYTFETGRLYSTVGSGLLFSNFADGARYSAVFPLVRGKVEALYSAEYGRYCALSLQGCNGGINPYDVVANLPADANVSDAGKRVFLTAEGESRPVWGLRGRGAVMFSVDMVKEKASSLQKLAYDPYYVLIGLTGFPVNPDWQIQWEVIYQGGSAYPLSNPGFNVKGNELQKIEAIATKLDVSWRTSFAKDWKNALLLTYAFGSGDTDKTNVLTPALSNGAGPDNAFYYFGGFSGGLALKPRLSNLHILRLGDRFVPFAASRGSLRKTTFEAKLSYYHKALADGVISDPKATEKKGSVGFAADLSAAYRLQNDLLAFVGYGIFLPGEAYPKQERDARHAILLSLTLNF